MTDLERLASWIKNSRFTTVFTGAGMSTESGLPDFRSQGGLWRQNRRFEELASTWALEHAYDEFVDFYRWRIEGLKPYEPHEGHRLIARWQQQGLVHALITQNVDGFHQLAGSPEVYQLHGNLRRIRCGTCRHEEDAERFLEPDGPTCTRCGGKMRPTVVLFGEALPTWDLDQAQDAARRSTLFIVLGSSLLVSPANILPQIAKASGSRLVILNRERTPLSDVADLCLYTSIKETLTALSTSL